MHLSENFPSKQIWKKKLSYYIYIKIYEELYHVFIRLKNVPISLSDRKLLQWNLFWETTAMRDHLSWKTRYSWQKILHFWCNWTCRQRPPVLRDHTFLWPMGWSFKTGSKYVKISEKLVLTHFIQKILKELDSFLWEPLCGYLIMLFYCCQPCTFRQRPALGIVYTFLEQRRKHTPSYNRHIFKGWRLLYKDTH